MENPCCHPTASAYPSEVQAIEVTAPVVREDAEDLSAYLKEQLCESMLRKLTFDMLYTRTDPLHKRVMSTAKEVLWGK